MKAYSQDLRDRAIDLHENEDYSKGKISRLLKVGYQTICEWVRRYKRTGDYSSKQHLVKGRKAKFTDKQAILDYSNHEKVFKMLLHKHLMKLFRDDYMYARTQYD